MADAVESWFRDLPYKFKREFAGKFQARVENARAKLAENAPEKSGKLKGTVRVVRKRGELDVEIVAGGPETTKEARKGSGAPYDYALAGELGTEHQPAKPWFYSTWAAGLRDETLQGINDDAAEIIGKA